ncbi:hypothetical protein XENTR_v10010857 [Xenopus tropicalis]|nr:hypothetical protein XENTR_v10010857 [Xenopus tropicalis]KAE8606760.1 hypothetical protein XENTR_v10010857 [Xenopus tropicalis]
MVMREGSKAHQETPSEQQLGVSSALVTGLQTVGLSPLRNPKQFMAGEGDEGEIILHVSQVLSKITEENKTHLANIRYTLPAYT